MQLWIKLKQLGRHCLADREPAAAHGVADREPAAAHGVADGE